MGAEPVPLGDGTGEAGRSDRRGVLLGVGGRGAGLGGQRDRTGGPGVALLLDEQDLGPERADLPQLAPVEGAVVVQRDADAVHDAVGVGDDDLAGRRVERHVGQAVGGHEQQRAVVLVRAQGLQGAEDRDQVGRGVHDHREDQGVLRGEATVGRLETAVVRVRGRQVVAQLADGGGVGAPENEHGLLRFL